MSAPRRMIATHDYVAKNANEITFKAGDAIFVPEGQPAGKMIKGVFNGKVGEFPRIYVNDTTVEHKAGGTTRVQAIRAYQGHGKEGHLEFPKGAKIFIVGSEDADHWKGVFGGVQGLVPRLYVEDATEKKLDTALAGKKCKAIKTLVNEDPAHLSFKIGQTVFVPKPDDSAAEWQGVANSTVGLFDKSYVVDTAEHSAEEIAAMIETNKKLPEEIEAMEKYNQVAEKKAAVLAGTAPKAAAADSDDDV